MDGQTGIIKTIDKPLHFLQKLADDKYIIFNEKDKVSEIAFPDFVDLEFKIAISENDVKKIRSLVEKIKGTKKKFFIKELVKAGYADIAL